MGRSRSTALTHLRRFVRNCLNFPAQPTSRQLEHVLRTASCHEAVRLVPERILRLGLRQRRGEAQLGIALRLPHRLRHWFVIKLRGLAQLRDLVGASSGMRQARRRAQSGTDDEHGG